MYAFINYLVQVSILTIVFITLYLLVFRKQTQFRINRAYLLSGLLLSWIIPLINIPLSISPGLPLPQLPTIIPDEILMNELIPETAAQSAQPIEALTSTATSTKSFPWWSLYWAGAAFILLKSLWVLGQIVLLRFRNSSCRMASRRIISGADLPAFSFFRWIFMNDKQINSSDKNLILAHEMAHSRQGHSLDLILIEIIQVFLWFNPFLILYKNALKECHEYLADKAVLNTGIDLQRYARSLQKGLFVYRNQKLASYFRGSTLKKRMIMATRVNPKRSGWKYLVVLPLLAISIISFSFVNDPLDFPSGRKTESDKFIVLLDPGHGGEDAGFVNEELGISEKDIVLAIGKKLKKAVAKDIEIILTRNKDEFLSREDRAAMAEIVGADIFISLHIGSFPDKETLAERYSTFFSPLNFYSDQSEQIASWFAMEYSFMDNDIKRIPQQAPYIVLREANCPAIQLEWSNISNSEDVQYLAKPSNQDIIADNLGITILSLKNYISAYFKDGAVEKQAPVRKHNSFIFPIRDEEIIRIAARYTKSRLHPILKIYRPHLGIDINAPQNTDVIVTDTGVVKDLKISRNRSGYGTWILIEHNNNIDSFYAHLDKCLVQIGDKIKRGQKIGEVGSTGMVVSPHLHFEIRKDGKAIDPIYMLGRIYSKVDQIRIGNTSSLGQPGIRTGAIQNFMKAKNMHFEEDIELTEVNIEKIGKHYYLFVLNSKTQASYAFELSRQGKDLLLNPDNPRHYSDSDQTGRKAFIFNDSKIAGANKGKYRNNGG
ncbi:MAG: peptidoglycan DD-metalloendopeptidase family protein [Bacteroidetes bacterium]|jgi:N-acetylmuramoyl-L-alanine amidase|nr:peptidoglycan DD-metalloendopeptidase family protein [Bacteroidota bacterium]MBT4399888.1 peptidoglycan DD-metalloendopeptidase family protein [Bacteroidota bacterium]MBT4410487.1 peptidoglycan DD-metalloendopeptidase family protein [Bacteroidota bacterium]MBT5427535.1 peptidoglycan DD-metalloendopeptidase family protein [Bacteroidota bacterium]MBT7093311.1 peptidoglycan DD-metalloendopeptidase family protein [Bacteroidota bacterium]